MSLASEDQSQPKEKLNKNKDAQVGTSGPDPLRLEPDRRQRKAGLAGEGSPDLDCDFRSLLLIVGHGGSWQQKEDDGAHDEGGGKEHLHIALREAQHPPAAARAVATARTGKGCGRAACAWPPRRGVDPGPRAASQRQERATFSLRGNAEW